MILSYLIRSVARLFHPFISGLQGTPTPEEIGYAESITSEEVSSRQVTIIRARDSKVATIVLRGATPNILDEVERTIGMCSNAQKSILQELYCINCIASLFR